MTNSNKNKTSPRMNQNSSGLGKMFEIITNNLNFISEMNVWYSKDIIKNTDNSNNKTKYRLPKIDEMTNQRD
jgi:hypothetical protein